MTESVSAPKECVSRRYLMEADAETRRLGAKFNPETTRQQLLDCGIRNLPANARILDAGSGPGFVSQTIAGIAGGTGNPTTISLLDLSDRRLKDAKDLIQPPAGITMEFLSCDAHNIAMADESVDFIFARFLFEYLKDPEKGFNELYRVLRKGGKMVLADLDFNCLIHYPLDAQTEAQMFEIAGEVKKQWGFDTYAGRKLYGYIHRAGMRDIEVRMHAHHLFYGTLREGDEINMESKLTQLERLQEAGLLDLSFQVKEFRKQYAGFMSSEDRFSYTPIIIVEGRK